MLKKFNLQISTFPPIRSAQAKIPIFSFMITPAKIQKNSSIKYFNEIHMYFIHYGHLTKNPIFSSIMPSIEAPKNFIYHGPPNQKPEIFHLFWSSIKVNKYFIHYKPPN